VTRADIQRATGTRVADGAITAPAAFVDLTVAILVAAGLAQLGADIIIGRIDSIACALLLVRSIRARFRAGSTCTYALVVAGFVLRAANGVIGITRDRGVLVGLAVAVVVSTVADIGLRSVVLPALGFAVVTHLDAARAFAEEAFDLDYASGGIGRHLIGRAIAVVVCAVAALFLRCHLT
jgi:hypothetical protein